MGRESVGLLHFIPQFHIFGWGLNNDKSQDKIFVYYCFDPFFVPLNFEMTVGVLIMINLKAIFLFTIALILVFVLLILEMIINTTVLHLKIYANAWY